jgi:hypothetical protein
MCQLFVDTQTCRGVCHCPVFENSGSNVYPTLVYVEEGEKEEDTDRLFVDGDGEYGYRNDVPTLHMITDLTRYSQDTVLLGLHPLHSSCCEVKDFFFFRCDFSFLFVEADSFLSLEQRVKVKLDLTWYYNTKEKPRCDETRSCTVFSSN